MAKIAENVFNFLEPIVSNLGYELADVEYEKKENGMNLTVFINSENGINITDCEKVHHAIDEPLDELNPTDDKPYILNVSSLGLDRPFKTDKDFKRNIGELVEARLFKPVDKKKVFEGTLLKFDSNIITLMVDGKEIELDRKIISKISKVIEF